MFDFISPEVLREAPNGPAGTTPSRKTPAELVQELQRAVYEIATLEPADTTMEEIDEHGSRVDAARGALLAEFKRLVIVLAECRADRDYWRNQVLTA